MLETVVGLMGLVLFLAPLTLIVRKAGYSPLWVMLALIPLVNFLALVLFALSEWPIETELQQLTQRPKSPIDTKAETSWELKRLAKRVTMVEQLAASEESKESAMQLLDTTDSSATEYFNQTLISIQQFLDSTPRDEERAFATNLLNTLRTFEDRIQDG